MAISGKQILAIIPARGGSKGIPKKNIQLVAGKPLISYSIDAAKRSKYINRIIVTTDDPEIENVSRLFGAEVIIRPNDISEDNSPSESALLHVIEYLEKNDNYSPDIIVFLQCTSPFTNPADIDGIIEKLISCGADSAFTTTQFDHFLWEIDSSGNCIGINHDKFCRKMRQERNDQFLETGSVYVMETDGFKEYKHRFFGKTIMYKISREDSLEIDNPIDLQIADIRMRDRNQMNLIQLLPQQIDALILDFDGVFTDNQVLISESGEEAVFCNRSDGFGVEQLIEAELKILVISKEANPVVKQRCMKLKIEFCQQIDQKLPILKEWINKKEIRPENVIYLGNDVNDIDCLNYVGCGLVVNDAHVDAVRNSKAKLESSGGKGAIREISDLIIKKMGDNHGKYCKN